MIQQALGEAGKALVASFAPGSQAWMDGVDKCDFH